MVKLKKYLFFIIFLFLLLPNKNVAAQSTILGPGDVAIVGYNSYTPTGTPQLIAIVFLVDINPGTTIGITDFGWDNNTDKFISNTGDGIIDWTADKYYMQGEIIVVTRGDNEEFNLRTSAGDQIFLFQGNVFQNPTLLFGVNFNYTSWQGSTTSSTTSALPPILSSSNASMVNQYRNSKINQTINQFNTPEAALDYIVNPNEIHWIGDDTITQDMPTESISIGPTPIHLSKFESEDKKIIKQILSLLTITLVSLVGINFPKYFQKTKIK